MNRLKQEESHDQSFFFIIYFPLNTPEAHLFATSSLYYTLICLYSQKTLLDQSSQKS